MLARRRRVTLLLAALGGVVVGAVACQGLVPLDGTEAPPDAGPPPAKSQPACSPILPEVPTVAGGGNMKLVFALSYLTTETRSPADAGVELCPENGFDLDDRATCWENEVLVKPADCASARCGPSCAGPRNCDGTATGIDNAAGALFADKNIIPAAARLAPLETAWRAGQQNVLLELGGYNGEANDQDVSLRIVRSAGVEERAVFLRDSDGGVAWDGEKKLVWSLAPGADLPSNEPQRGYVNNYVLVLRDAKLRLPTMLYEVEITSATLTAELVRRGNDWQLRRGRVGGRITLANLLQATRAPLAKTNGALCEQDGFDAALAVICSRLDLADDSSGSCAALSIGMGFTASAAVIGTVRPVDTVDLRCNEAQLLAKRCP